MLSVRKSSDECGLTFKVIAGAPRFPDRLRPMACRNLHILSPSPYLYSHQSYTSSMAPLAPGFVDWTGQFSAPLSCHQSIPPRISDRLGESKLLPGLYTSRLTYRQPGVCGGRCPVTDTVRLCLGRTYGRWGFVRVRCQKADHGVSVSCGVIAAT